VPVPGRGSEHGKPPEKRNLYENMKKARNPCPLGAGNLDEQTHAGCVRLGATQPIPQTILRRGSIHVKEFARRDRQREGSPGAGRPEWGRGEIEVSATDAQRLISIGLLEMHEGRLRLTPQGAEVEAVLHAVEQANGKESLPDWNAGQRVLTWCGKAIKKLKRYAPTQDSVLKAFQTCGWQRRIKDPLQKDGKSPDKERRYETAKRLNKKLAEGTICFHATSDGFLWEPVVAEKAQKPGSNP